MNRKFTKNVKRRLVTALVIVLSFIFLLPHAEVLAAAGTEVKTLEATDQLIVEDAPEESIIETKVTVNLPVNEIKITRTVVATVTAYNAVAAQTDSTPCITADGTDICQPENQLVVAANWLPFGTKVRIPEYFGDTVFEVHDRMNKRYNDRLDVLLPTIPESKKFGVRRLTIEIL